MAGCKTEDVEGRVEASLTNRASAAALRPNVGREVWEGVVSRIDLVRRELHRHPGHLPRPQVTDWHPRRLINIARGTA